MKSKVPVISVRGISKIFGKVKACNNVNIDIYPGEIHALLGENGAGKSTLINILSGVYSPDRGNIKVKGMEKSFSSPKDSTQCGIGTIYQHFKLVNALTARENIMLGQEKKIFISRKPVDEKVKEISFKYGIEVDLDKYVGDMSVGEKQNLEILKVLYRGAEVLILDEPTAVFTPQETEKLFNIMKKMREQGCGIIFITHKMDEVMEVSDKITVLRKGETVATLPKFKTNAKELTELMVGRSIDLSIKKIDKLPGKEVLEIKNLRALNTDGMEAVKNISFNVKEGEILGIAGITGCGQKELCEALAGIGNVSQGEIIFNGENLKGKNPREFIKRGISMSFIPEDRLGMGLVASMNMVDNLILKSYHTQKGPFISKKAAVKDSLELIDTLEIKTPGINYPIRYLSGGNIQKILLGRELSSSPKVLIMAYPVRGLDINTCYNIYDLINKEKEKGTSIIFVGEDLDVLMELCDRIMVLCHGEISGIIDAQEATREKLGLMMLGNSKEKGEELLVKAN
ncbi:nucleoside ABC transporter ATP-binding protein [Clostridium amylolyticum]|uniref:Nucleoside ABC transporter ATP-binding protein n=1 Tax=Clostridium amylolyticum TaxID=1121298 RepID=A0A1M6AZV7_9CLOT|nr:ABC transporter ATP-binding protein [Clostridium amylolyticum]SHI41967.1 nucleoside ABC transporter ATP-binding protein [Clostridium amylolyticum]